MAAVIRTICHDIPPLDVDGSMDQRTVRQAKTALSPVAMLLLQAHFA
jgi:hypothetical protein